MDKQITLSKKQYRQLCDAYINTVNMMPQLLMITPLQDDRSPDALYALQTTIQTVERQLKGCSMEFMADNMGNIPLTIMALVIVVVLFACLWE
ncbi:hypothetical protein [Yersinia intermedia]|uniref:hypothetical protein n=1 Tax=Yersinia intermedia TaxID=631 RepID=UPI001CFD1B50|nr:hypothetical protein [Yersinia intermedia]MCB5313619.1 hypothetical protein [Yersinia intermedia]